MSVSKERISEIKAVLNDDKSYKWNEWPLRISILYKIIEELLEAIEPKTTEPSITVTFPNKQEATKRLMDFIKN
ncbi:MAG: hypothetical protein LLG05_18710 [Porphyromonadaceae bacterium]|nr:hypothetical protein [Porphyromonadaceae bacterium]